MVKIKVMTILGTRPEIIRLSEIIKRLDNYANHILVHTNQNYDYELNQIFFEELGLRKPDYVLDVKGDTIGDQIGQILSQCEAVMMKEKPDSLLILGDTNSALSCIIAKRLKIPIFHMEAGNRCFDDRVPEEINRRIVDHTSDVNICYTEHARRNILHEGINPQYVFVSGSPLLEVYMKNMEKIEDSDILEELKLEKHHYFVASIHREENVDDNNNFRSLITALNKLVEIYDFPIIFSTHPRTKKRIKEMDLKINKKIIFMKPFGMFDYIKLQKNAFCNLSDSGTIHEDAAILGIPAINIRESNERPEVYDMGNLIMSGVEPDTILNCVMIIRKQYDNNVFFEAPHDYTLADCSDRVIRLIAGYSKIVTKNKYHI